MPRYASAANIARKLSLSQIDSLVQRLLDLAKNPNVTIPQACALADRIYRILECRRIWAGIAIPGVQGIPARKQLQSPQARPGRTSDMPGHRVGAFAQPEEPEEPAEPSEEPADIGNGEQRRRTAKESLSAKTVTGE